MRKQSTPKVQSANSTCRAMGHDWMTTASANWRVCTREKCRASERLDNGQWVSNAQALKHHTPVIESHQRPLQSRMWDEQPTR